VKWSLPLQLNSLLYPSWKGTQLAPVVIVEISENEGVETYDCDASCQVDRVYISLSVTQMR
jgi:hypothetical protein